MFDSAKPFSRIFIALSVLIPVLVAILLYLPKKDGEGISPWILNLPFYNAIINTFTAILLMAGVWFVRKGMVRYHKMSMMSAFMLGAVFLVFYIIYHANTASTSYGGEGIVKMVYYFFLLTHILLAFVVVPLVLSAIYFALADKIDSHKKIVKFTFPVWLYVSVTGVIVYLMISPYYAH
jgi:putative membrane protein